MNSNIPTLTYPKDSIFQGRYLDSKSFYLALHNAVPSISFMDPLNGEKAFRAFTEKYTELIEQVHTYEWYKHEKKKYQFDRTIVRLRHRAMIEFGPDYCELLHDGRSTALMAELTTFFARFKERRKREPLEINLIVKGYEGLELKPMEIKRSKLDIDLFYEDDFKEVDELIRKRLNSKNDKGIVLLHGLPGTGKTTYLRYLVGKLKKQVLFLSPGIAGSLMDPSFVQLLIDNPNTVVIVEDAEEIITDRRLSASSSVSNLLNISDGLLADFLNVQLVCTFNNSLTMVDNALMRKGRLIAKYEFGKLSVPKAQRLSNHWGHTRRIEQPMTVAEIATQQEMHFETRQVEVIGFRRA